MQTGTHTLARWLVEVWREWHRFFLFILVMLVFRSAIGDWNQVPTGSMKPTILEGDRVVVNKLAYNLKLPFTTWHLLEWGHPQHGEIVTFYSPADERLLIKRVVGVPGDVVAMYGNRLVVNGEVARYSPLDPAQAPDLDAQARQGHELLRERIGPVVHAVLLRDGGPTPYGTFGPVRVPEGEYLMLGDNRDHSGDSRLIGFIDEERITGRAYAVAFSVDYEDFYLPRADRFGKSLD